MGLAPSVLIGAPRMPAFARREPLFPEAAEDFGDAAPNQWSEAVEHQITRQCQVRTELAMQERDALLNSEAARRGDGIAILAAEQQRIVKVAREGSL